MIYFITEAYLKSFTPISSNVDVKDLTPHISVSEDMYIKDVLGSKLFKSLKATYSAQTLTAIEEELVTLIKPALAYRTLEMALPFLQTQIRNKGLMNNSSEGAIQADLGYMKYLRSEAKDRSEYYTKRIQDFLCDNSTSFPDYTNPDSPIRPNTNTGYDCDLYFPNN